MEAGDLEKIAQEFRNCIFGTVKRMGAEDTHRPFHAALLSEQVLFWSRFERSFSTSFGQRAIEQISRVIALAGGATKAENQKETIVNLSESQLSAIERHISGLREGSLGRPARWEDDLREVQGSRVADSEGRQRVISDLWWCKNGVNHYLSIKTVKPNIDQTAEAKRDILKLKINDPQARVYFGLYYNPFGESRSDYAWGPPNRIFDMLNDEVVLIGRDYWDTLGGAGTYDLVLEVARQIGGETRQLIAQLSGG